MKTHLQVFLLTQFLQGSSWDTAEKTGRSMWKITKNLQPAKKNGWLDLRKQCVNMNYSEGLSNNYISGAFKRNQYLYRDLI